MTSITKQENRIKMPMSSTYPFNFDFSKYGMIELIYMSSKYMVDFDRDDLLSLVEELQKRLQDIFD